MIRRSQHRQFTNININNSSSSGSGLGNITQTNRRHKRKMKLIMLWFHRICIVLIWLFIMGLLTVRIIVWSRTLNNQSPSSTSSTSNIDWDSPHKFHSDAFHEPTDYLPITICNVNPIRALQLFKLTNGSALYDTISSKSDRPTLVLNKYIYQILGQSLMDKISHNISEMLKGCLRASNQCNVSQFQRKWIHHQMCFQMFIRREDSYLTLVLDPEEHNYLIPGSGVIGFRMYLQKLSESMSRHSNNNNNNNNMVLVLSKRLHTVVSILRTHITKISCPSSTSNCSSCIYSIKSISHSIPSPFLGLIPPHSPDSERYIKQITNALLLQRITLLRLHHPITLLQSLLTHILHIHHKSHQSASDLVHNASTDLTRILYIQDHQCQLPQILSQLHNISFTYSTHQPLIPSLIHPTPQSIIILLSSFVFTKPTTTTKSLYRFPSYSHTFIKHLSFLNLQIRSATTKQRMRRQTSSRLISPPLLCGNTIIRKIAQLYTVRIRRTIELLRDGMTSWSQFQYLIKQLRNSSQHIIQSIIRATKPTQSRHRLVTVTMDIVTEEKIDRPAKLVHINTTLDKFKILVDLLDIVCSNVAIAVLFMLAMRCMRRLYCASTSSPINSVNRPTYLSSSGGGGVGGGVRCSTSSASRLEWIRHEYEEETEEDEETDYENNMGHLDNMRNDLSCTINHERTNTTTTTNNNTTDVGPTMPSSNITAPHNSRLSQVTFTL